MNQNIYLAALLHLPNIATNRVLQLLHIYKTAKTALENYKDWNILPKVQQQLVENELKDFKIEKLQEKLNKTQTQLLGLDDPDYPELLKQIADPPILLFMQGNKDCLAIQYKLGVVGTRYPSAYGSQATQKIISELQSNFCIVSGFQRGIDSVAHQAALDNETQTIAVLGTGLDIDYPSGNYRLKQRMLHKDLLISEYPLGTQPRAGTFPRRNRIISGLSQAVLVIEAGIKSGSLVTAQCALDQNRDLFAVPGSIFSAHSQGPNYLLSQGANVVTKAQDILIYYNLSFLQKETKTLLEGVQLQIFNALSAELYLDQLSHHLLVPTAELLSQLTVLELSGHVLRLDDGRYMRATL